MDKMDSHRTKARVPGRWQKRPNQKKNDVSRRIWQSMKTYKRLFVTGVLLVVLLGLLFGIASKLSAPVVSTAPPDVTTVSYSGFVEQIEAGNVLAVAIQGNKLAGLLNKGLGASTGAVVQVTPTPAGQAKTANVNYVAWAHAMSASGSSLTSPAQSLVDPSTSIYTQAPAGSMTQLMALLLAKHVTIMTQAVQQSTGWLSVIWKFLPLVILVFLLVGFISANSNKRMTRGMDDRISQIGKSRAKRFVRAKEASTSQPAAKSVAERPGKALPTGAKAVQLQVPLAVPVTFADVAGIDEVKADLEEIVRFLRSPEQFKRLGARIPRGALLVGPPGTGKTLLARAVAGEANVPFFSMSASEFVEMFVGVGASRVRDLFNQARQAAPCVVFIDEIDAVGRKRSMRINGNDEREQTLNQLLIELDGFNERQTVVVLAATNRLDILDKAMLRPGRFDRRIMVSLPDRVGREAILKVHTRKTPLHEGVSLERLARMTTGMSGADLANLVNEAALGAARDDLATVTHPCFEDALARVQLGALRPLVMSEADRRTIAFHEGGHALVAHLLSEADSVNRVTILPRGQSLGVTQFMAEEDRYNYSREMLMARIAVGLGGRTAEELIFGQERITTGAENDLQVVTGIARRMVTRWGMSKELGVMFVEVNAGEAEFGLNMRRTEPADVSMAHTLALDAAGRPQQMRKRMVAMASETMSAVGRNNTGATLNALIDAEVRAILEEGRAMAWQLLVEHREQLHLIAETLMVCEQLDRVQFEALLAEG